MICSEIDREGLNINAVISYQRVISVGETRRFHVTGVMKININNAIVSLLQPTKIVLISDVLLFANLPFLCNLL